MVTVTEALRLTGLVDTTWFTIEARDRGQAVHRAIEYYNEGTLDESSLLDEGVRARFNTYRKFRDEVAFDPIATELELRNETIGLVGHLDMIGFVNTYLSIVDTKPPGEQPWHGLQLAAYARLANMNGHPGAIRKYNLYLGTKNYKLVERKNYRDWPVFLAALTVAHFMKESK